MEKNVPGLESFGPITLLIILNVISWEKYGSLFTREDQMGESDDIPRPRGQGEAGQ